MNQDNSKTYKDGTGPYGHPFIFAAQIASLGMIWIFVLGIGLWIANLIQLSWQWNDAIGATVGISLIAVPVFATLAGVLTYVFIGLHRENRRVRESLGED